MKENFITVNLTSKQVGRVDSWEMDILIDVHTGVNYIVSGIHGNNWMCPRYNADGTLMITPLDKLQELVNKVDQSDLEYI